MTPSERAVAVTTQEALDGYREKTMRIATVGNYTLNSVLISSAGTFDMTHCDLKSLGPTKIRTEVLVEGHGSHGSTVCVV